MGVAFETPLIMFLLAQLGIVSSRRLSRFRKVWVVLAFILGALITPTFDPINQTFVALPCWHYTNSEWCWHGWPSEAGARQRWPSCSSSAGLADGFTIRKKEPAASRFFSFAYSFLIGSTLVPSFCYWRVWFVLFVIAKQRRLEGADSLAHGTSNFRHPPPPEDQQYQSKDDNNFKRADATEESHLRPQASRVRSRASA